LAPIAGYMFVELRERIKKQFYGKPIIWPTLVKAKGLWYSANHWYYYRSRFGEKNVSLREINIEFNSTCNLRCKFCSLDFDKPREYMSPELLQSVLDQLKNDSRFSNVQQINLYNGGETLLHPNRLEMFQLIGKAKQEARQSGKKFPKVLMLTNGMLMREKLAREILETDSLDTIQFSLDGGTPEKFEELRVNARWKPFYENVKTLHRLKTEMGIDLKLKSITIVEEPHPLKTDWMHEEFKEIINLMDHYELRRLHDWGGEVELENENNKVISKKGCMLLMHQMVVLPNGDVTVCCNDLNSKGVIGNLNEQSLHQVYASKNRRVYLDKLNQGKKHELELCKNCESF
jgi:radical SAM protein with 4Fe4S-binding SPASM domain